ncbi:hypothetical protein SUGI_0903580 [Cryptomeria japonica]|uniref:auxin-responsive protein IAA1 n=1 Tax=Cryptomeria japonica TaxID=3369 RepID=UPI0024147923|nr:auxin-responsive protein IAA1 [Cryptomeria japonica]GLJ43458.1 hypothetical protein SUGI_0903580 [Cryptomeria japonica]
MDSGADKGGEIFHAWRDSIAGGAQNANSSFYARLLAGPNYRYQGRDGTRTCADTTGTALNRAAAPFLQNRQSAFVAPAGSNTGPVDEFSDLGFPFSFPLHLAAPQVTVVLEGRSICQRICLDHHANYESFARALRKMFADIVVISSLDDSSCINLANAVPGHLIAYEDIEGDLLLAGDLSWKDFVRAAKRIRILPAKNPPRKSH